MADEPTIDSESGESPRLAGPENASLAAKGAAFLRSCGYSIEGFSRSEKEIDSQADRLVEWAKSENILMDYQSVVSGLEAHTDHTAEHIVFYRSTDNRAIKVTHAGAFGVTPDAKGQQIGAPPLFYLRRLELMNRVFCSDFRMEGLVLRKSLIIGQKGVRPSIVVSQPWIDAADPNDPHPTLAEIADFMTDVGFMNKSKSYFGWYRQRDLITVLDARTDNYIKSPDGVVPIDLVISQATLPPLPWTIVYH